MISEGHISHLELLLLLCFVIGSKIFLIVSNVVVREVYNSAPLALCCGIVLSLGITYCLYVLLKRFPGDSIIKVCERILGTILGKSLAVIITLFFLVTTALRLREFSETISAVVLPTTPISVIIMTYMIISVYASLLGIEAISRSARLLLPFVIAPALFVIALILPLADFTRIYPLIDVPISDIAKTGTYTTSFFGEVVFLGLVAPYLRKSKTLFYAGTFGIVISGLAMIANTLLSVAVLTARDAVNLQFPTFVLASLATLGSFIQRVEAIYVFVWFFSAAITLSALFYGTCLSTAQILGLTEFKPLVWSVGVITYTVAFLPSNIVTAFNSDTKGYGTVLSILVMLIPPALLALALILKKKGQETEDDCDGSTADDSN